MIKIRTVIVLILSLFFMNGKAQDSHDITSDSILHRRIWERVSLLNDYMTYISNRHKPFATRQYYVQKATSLFMPNAIVHIRGCKAGHITKISVKEFLRRGTYDSKCFRIYDLDSIQVPNWRSEKLASSDSTIWVDAKVLKFHQGDVYNYSDSLMLVKEATDLREEWRPLLGNLFLSYKHIKRVNDDTKQDITASAVTMDSVGNSQCTTSQRTQSKHVRCKSKTRGRVLRTLQRRGNKKGHSKEQGRKEEESSDVTQPRQLQVEE